MKIYQIWTVVYFEVYIRLNKRQKSPLEFPWYLFIAKFRENLVFRQYFFFNLNIREKSKKIEIIQISVCQKTEISRKNTHEIQFGSCTIVVR